MNSAEELEHMRLILQHFPPVPDGFDLVFSEFDAFSTDGIAQICDCLLCELAFAWVGLMFEESTWNLSHEGNVHREVGTLDKNVT